MGILDCILKAGEKVGAILKSPFFMIASALDVLDNTLDLGERISSAIKNARTKKNATKRILAMSENANEYDLTSFFEKAEFNNNSNKFKNFNQKSQKEKIKILIACYQNSESFETAIRDIVKQGKLEPVEYEKYIDLFCVFYGEAFLEFDFDSLDKQGKALYRSLTANFSEQISKFDERKTNNQDPFIQELKTTLDTIMLILAQNQEDGAQNQKDGAQNQDDGAQKISVSYKPLQYIVRQCPECGYRGEHISYSDDDWCYCSACGTKYMAYKNDPELVTVVQNGVNEILDEIEKDKLFASENIKDIKKKLLVKFEGVLTTKEFNNALQDQNNNLTEILKQEIIKVKGVFLEQFKSIEEKLNNQSDKLESAKETGEEALEIAKETNATGKRIEETGEEALEIAKETNALLKKLLENKSPEGGAEKNASETPPEKDEEDSENKQTNDVPEKNAQETSIGTIVEDPKNKPPEGVSGKNTPETHPKKDEEDSKNKQTNGGAEEDIPETPPEAAEGNNSNIYISAPDPVDYYIDFAPERTKKSSKSENIFTIPEGCKSIEAYAFKDRDNLERVIIPDSVEKIGDYAFEGCTSLENITIPESVKVIGKAAFKGCGLTSIIIPNSITEIGESAFEGCTSLENITIPESVKVIGKAAFKGCGLTSLKVPKSVTEIGESAFDNCIGLNTIVSASNLLKRGELVFGNRFCLKYIAIPNGVTEIGASAFRGCSGLASIFIPESVKVIGESAFEGCSGLNEVHITDLASWCNIAFSDNGSCPLYYAHNLYINGKIATDITIPSSVTSICASAFRGCSGLASIFIPESVKVIGESAFEECSGLTIYCEASSQSSSWNSSWNGNSKVYYGMNSKNYIEVNNCKFVLRNDELELEKYTGLSAALVIPSQVTLGAITHQVTSIGQKPFKNCSGLTSITIPNSITRIEDNAFDGCSGLTSITIPNSVTYIGDLAFDGCSGLKEVHITDLASWCNITFDGFLSNPLYYANNLYINGKIATDITIPNSVTSIGYSSFLGCSGLTSITIPNSVTSIGDSAFLGCSGLISITIPNSVTSIEDTAFYGCSGLTSITIPDSVTCIGGVVFCGCSGLTSITIPNSVTYIGDLAFDGCSGLTSITIPNSVTSIGHHVFCGCSGLTSITIPNSVTYIGECAFSGCSGLTSITIPNSVTYIGKLAFNEWESNQEIYIKGRKWAIGWDKEWKGLCKAKIY